MAAGIAVSAIAAFAGRAEAQEKPDAPMPQVGAQPQQEKKTSVSDQIFKKTPLELFLGFKPNLAPFEIPDNAPPMRASQKYAYAFHEAEDFKAHLGNVLQRPSSRDSMPSRIMGKVGGRMRRDMARRKRIR